MMTTTMTRNVLATAALLAAALLAACSGDDGGGALPTGDGTTAPVQSHSIINGTPSLGTAYRAVPVLWTNNEYLCTGTLIAPNVVLTAAHCFYVKGCDRDGENCQLETDASKVLVTFGTAENDPAGESIRGARAILHPGYLHKNPYPNDLALLILASAAKTATPFPHLPNKAGLRWSASDVGTAITVVGFGQTTTAYWSAGTRMRMDSKVSHYCDPTSPGETLACHCDYGSGFCYASASACSDSNRFCLKSVAGFSDAVPMGSVICHVPNATSQLICSGDSGGPTFVTRSGVTYVAGVTSFGDTDCQHLGCSTDVSAYADWIEAILNDELGIALPLGNTCTQPESCASGFCVDGVCCDDACGEAACQACAMARGATRNGTCTAISGSCDDGDPCTVGDICAAGTCQAGPSLTCATPPDGECYGATGTCQPQTGQCQYVEKSDGTPCDGGAGTCQSGNCTPSAVEPDAGSGADEAGDDASTTDPTSLASDGGATGATADGSSVIRVTGEGGLGFLSCASAPGTPGGAALLVLLALGALPARSSSRSRGRHR